MELCCSAYLFYIIDIARPYALSRHYGYSAITLLYKLRKQSDTIFCTLLLLAGGEKRIAAKADNLLKSFMWI